MTYDSDRQVTNAAGDLGCVALVAGLIVVPPLILPAFVLYKLAVVSGAMTLHPAILIVLAVGSIWAILRLGGMLIRSVPAWIAQLVIGAYIGACYTYACFQRQLTSARAELDVTWLLFGFAVFSLIGWKIAGSLVEKACSRELARTARRGAS